VGEDEWHSSFLTPEGGEVFTIDTRKFYPGTSLNRLVPIEAVVKAYSANSNVPTPQNF
jgi:hypothetical protein